MMVFSLASALLAGCGNNSQTSDTTQNTKEAAKDDSKDGASNSLTVWCWDPAFNIYAMQQAEEIYKKTNPDFKLIIEETPWNDLQTKLTTAATSGNLKSLPDIILMQDNAYQKNVITYPDVFVDLTSSGIDFAKFAPAKVGASVVDNKNYGVPFDNGTSITALRTDVLEEAGYTIEDFTDITWDKFIEQGKVVFEKTGKPLISTQAGEPDLLMQMLQSAGSSMFDADGKPSMVSNEALKAAIATYKELVSSKVLMEVNNWDQYIGSITNETVAGAANGCWILASIQTSEDQKGKWAVTNFPSLEGVTNATNYSNQGGSSWGITTNSKNQELAMDFLNKTFAGSVELYETILPTSGAIGAYMEAANSPVYGEKQEFFSNDAIYSKIANYAGKVPSNNTGVYWFEARDAMGTALTNVIGGADIDSEIKAAEDQVRFQMGE